MTVTAVPPCPGADHGWVDDGSESGLVLVTGYRRQSTDLWSCDPVALECGTLPVGEGDVRITR